MGLLAPLAGSRSLWQAVAEARPPVSLATGDRPERARRGGQREAPHSRGSTSLSATLLKLHRTAAFSAVLAANRNAASDLLHPAVGEEQVAWICDLSDLLLP
jgi:hypothetical protein